MLKAQSGTEGSFLKVQVWEIPLTENKTSVSEPSTPEKEITFAFVTLEHLWEDSSINQKRKVHRQPDEE